MDVFRGFESGSSFILLFRAKEGRDHTSSGAHGHHRSQSKTRPQQVGPGGGPQGQPGQAAQSNGKCRRFVWGLDPRATPVPATAPASRPKPALQTVSGQATRCSPRHIRIGNFYRFSHLLAVERLPRGCAVFAEAVRNGLTGLLRTNRSELAQIGRADRLDFHDRNILVLLQLLSQTIAKRAQIDHRVLRLKASTALTPA